MTLDATQVRTHAQGRWIGILHGLVPALESALERPGRHGPCPIHGGSDGFRVFRDVAHTGGGICNSCGAFADGFALLRWLTGWTFPVALEAVGVSLGLTEQVDRLPVRAVAAPSALKARSVAACQQALRSTWGESLAPTDPAAWPLWRYLVLLCYL
ncbi:primase-helicase zinc-binding domain-containing protein [uncultured Thiocystis sp.]|jgi:phage/plasmid primase-like uncharacterized protein|uniref:primase-helicase zinc-binding domain-containing protein n=1 Tax=uncultured Thiocystis sp. TaxID=1202134 RepID=UPI0025E1EF21|nr:primase-helicase zinc-binding domain-containing protein [uncultured Thiocystis sp.]